MMIRAEVRITDGHLRHRLCEEFVEELALRQPLSLANLTELHAGRRFEIGYVEIPHGQLEQASAGLVGLPSYQTFNNWLKRYGVEGGGS